MTRNLVKAALLAGLTVLTGGLALRFLPAPAQAQNRGEVLTAITTHTTSRYTMRALPDGGTYEEDTFQLAVDVCRRSSKVYEAAKSTHYALGTPTVGELKTLYRSLKADCKVAATLRTTVDAAKAVEQGADDAYEWRYVRERDGGS